MMWGGCTAAAALRHLSGRSMRSYLSISKSTRSVLCQKLQFSTATPAAAAAGAAPQMETMQCDPQEECKQQDQGLNEVRQRILEASLRKVPEFGWTEEALAAGVTSLGYPAISHGIIQRGPMGLIEFFADEINEKWLSQLQGRQEDLNTMPPRARLKLAIQMRLGLLAPYNMQWPQALAVSIMPKNLDVTPRLFGRVVDELCRHTTEQASGYNQTAHRAAICYVYISTQLFFLTDYSNDFQHTWEFLDRRLDDLDRLTRSPDSVRDGLEALIIPATSIASAVVSLGGPLLADIIQQTLGSKTLKAGLQSIIANTASMAPPRPPSESWRDSSEGSTDSPRQHREEDNLTFAAPHEVDPWGDRADQMDHRKQP